MNAQRSRTATRPLNLTILTVATVTGLVLLGGTAHAAEDTATAAGNEISIGASVPMVVPFSISSSIGTGFLPSLQLDLASGLGLNLTSGFIYYSEDDDTKGRDDGVVVPVLLGVTYTFNAGQRLRPYAAVAAGYSYAHASESKHWLSATVGGGVLVRATESMDFDVGVNLIGPDLRGNATDDLSLMFRIGARFGV